MSNMVTCECGLILSVDKLITHIQENHSLNTNMIPFSLNKLKNMIEKTFPSGNYYFKTSTSSHFILCLHLENALIELPFYRSTSSELPKTISEAKEFLLEISEFIKKIQSEVKKIGVFQFFYCKNFNPKLVKSDCELVFDFQVSGSDEIYSETFHPYDHTESIYQFVQSFQKYFISFLEGEPVLIDKHGGYFDEYAINDTPISYFFENAKKIRLKIIEPR